MKYIVSTLLDVMGEKIACSLDGCVFFQFKAGKTDRKMCANKMNVCVNE